MTRLTVPSRSRAEDAAYLALADIAEVTNALGVGYRIIGGHMVTLHCARHELEVPHRQTQDADLGVEALTIGDTTLVERLRGRGYQVTQGNRLTRTSGVATLAIDVLVPAETSRARHSRPVGPLFVDEVPGLRYALSTPPHELEVDVRLTDDARLAIAVTLPGLVPALCLKLLAYRARLAVKDAVDVWRLLEVAYADGLTAADWPARSTPRAAAEVLRRHFTQRNGAGVKDAAGDSAQQARVRALAQRLVGVAP